MSQSIEAVDNLANENNTSDASHFFDENQIPNSFRLPEGLERPLNQNSSSSDSSSVILSAFEGIIDSENSIAFDDCNNESESTESPNSSAFFSTTSTDTEDLCVVCMDRKRDIRLEPCGHTACCAACFMRLESQKCPVCRTQAEAAHFIGTGRKFEHHRFCQSRTSETNNDIINELQNNPEALHIYHLPPQYGAHHGGPSMLSIASQAPYSMRDRSSSQNRAFLGIESANISFSERIDEVLPPSRESSYLIPRVSSVTLTQSEDNLISSLVNEGVSPFSSVHREPRPTLDHSIQSAPSVVAMPTAVLMRPRIDSDRSHVLSTTLQPRNVVLLGSSSSLMLGLVSKLQSIFRPPLWEIQSIYRRDPTLLYINNQPLRFIILERTSDALNVSTFVEEIKRYSPKIVLLCADFYNLGSFETIVRIDLEFLDSLNTNCFWIIIKHDRGRQRRRESANQVEVRDVSSAQHYLGVTRRWFVASIDRMFASDVRKLGRELHDVVWNQSNNARRTFSSESVGRRRISLRSLFSRSKIVSFTRARG